MARSEDQYLDKITTLQQSMHKREKRRLELERELFAYSRSDKRISQIKCSKLHSYLKQICDREARAKKRNLELLRDVECLEISMQEYCPDRGPLQQHKADFLNTISRFIEERKNIEQDIGAAKVQSARRRHQNSTLSHPAEDFTQPPFPIFMGRQTSRGSNAETRTTSVHSHQALHRSPNRSIHSHERLPSGLLKDFRVGGEDAASNGAHLSDDISGSNDSPDGCNLSDKHERTLAALPSVQAFPGVAGNVPFGSDDEQEPPPLVTLTGLVRNPSPCRSSGSPMRLRNSPAEHSDSREVARQTPIIGDAGRSLSHLMPETTFGKEPQDKPDKYESSSSLSSDVQLPESSASDLSISLTPSELEDDLPEGVASGRNATSDGSEVQNWHGSESALDSDDPQLNRETTSPAGNVERLSQEGLFHLLDSIEQKLHGGRTSVYGSSSVDERQRVRIISFCNGGADLNDEDLEACGAVVLHELQRLSWSTAKGCLLPKELLSARQSSTEPYDISTSLPPDAARLWDRWFKHALLLKERCVLSTEHLVEQFTPLLLERHATHSHQAKVLLRTLLSRSSEECPSAEDQSDLSSSCGSSLLADDANSKPSGLVRKQRIQELQSSEEDNRDESPVESVPIRETKAYQLLKQSAMQERLQSSEEEDEEDDDNVDGLSGINHGREVDLGRAKCSSHQDPYPRTEKTDSRFHSAPQSKAFFGESDDSDWEIEAALRPPALNKNNDDIDDFYD